MYDIYVYTYVRACVCVCAAEFMKHTTCPIALKGFHTNYRNECA